MSVIALCGQKGGVGKSTTAIAVAAELRRRGHRVLLVDGDPQGTASTWAAKAGEAGLPVPTVIAMNARMHLPGHLDAISRHHDYVVIDCPGRLDAVQKSALMVADLAIIPCGPSGPDAWALEASVELVNQAAELRPELRACVLVAKKIVGTNLHGDARKQFAAWGLPVLRTELCTRIAYQEAITGGFGVTEYASGEDAAGLEVKALVDELLREMRHAKEGSANRRRGSTQAAEARR